MIIKISILLIVLYISLVSFLFINQRHFIYFPDKTVPAPVQGVESIKVNTSDGLSLAAWYIPPKIENKQVILFFHGNAGNYAGRMSKILGYLGAGYGVLLAEYRGYAGNSGEISEQGLYNDGRAYMDWLSSEKGMKPSQIVLYGESLGSGVAVEMASENDVAGLILESPFSSLLEVASRIYLYIPVNLLLKDRFMNTDKIMNVHAPILIMHGQKDEVIPFDLAKKLFKKANDPKKLVDFPEGNHNNLYDYGASTYVLDFLSGINSDNKHNIEK